MHAYRAFGYPCTFRALLLCRMPSEPSFSLALPPCPGPLNCSLKSKCWTETSRALVPFSLDSDTVMVSRYSGSPKIAFALVEHSLFKKKKINHSVIMLYGTWVHTWVCHLGHRTWTCINGPSVSCIHY